MSCGSFPQFTVIQALKRPNVPVREIPAQGPNITQQRLTALIALCKNLNVAKGDLSGNDIQEEETEHA